MFRHDKPSNHEMPAHSASNPHQAGCGNGLSETESPCKRRRQAPWPSNELPIARVRPQGLNRKCSMVVGHPKAVAGPRSGPGRPAPNGACRRNAGNREPGHSARMSKGAFPGRGCASRSPCRRARGAPAQRPCCHAQGLRAARSGRTRSPQDSRRSLAQRRGYAVARTTRGFRRPCRAPTQQPLPGARRSPGQCACQTTRRPLSLQA